MENLVKLSKSEMKMVVGGVDELVIIGECVNKCNIDCPCKDSRDWCDNGLCKSRN
nr:hypothetical protein [Pseudopedobacter sp.]